MVIGDAHGTIVVHVIGELVEMLEEGKVYAFDNVKFHLNESDGGKNLSISPAYNSTAHEVGNNCIP